MLARTSACTYGAACLGQNSLSMGIMACILLVQDRRKGLVQLLLLPDKNSSLCQVQLMANDAQSFAKM